MDIDKIRKEFKEYYFTSSQLDHENKCLQNQRTATYLSKLSTNHNIPLNTTLYLFWLMGYIKNPFQPTRIKFIEIKKALPHLSKRTWIRSDKKLIELGILLKHQVSTTTGKKNYYYFLEEDDLNAMNSASAKMAPGASAKMAIGNTNNNLLLNNNNKSINNKKRKKENNLAKRNIVADRNNNKKKKRSSLKVKKIISSWSSMGYPFAQVRKPESVQATLTTILKSCQGQTNPIIQTFKRAHPIMRSQNFIKNQGKKNFTLREFIELSERSLSGKWLLENYGKKYTWYKIFDLKSDEWISQHLLRLPKLNKEQKRVKAELETILSFNGTPQYDVDKGMAIAAKQLCKLSDKNNYGVDTMLYDFERFIKSQDTRNHQPYYYIGKDFWNFKFAKYINQTRNQQLTII